MTTFASASKSNRLLQSKRYTIAQFDNSEAFTNVLDINTSEIYTQTNSLPLTNLPYSQSSQDSEFITSGSDNIAQYKFRLQLTPGNVANSGKYQAWFALSSSGHDPTVAVSTQVIQPNQLTSWISNKYIAPSLATKVAENTVAGNAGYNIVVSKGANAGSATELSGNDYQFDYKTGVLQFVGLTQSPTTSERLYLSGYTYVGKTLDTFVASGSGGGGAGVGFPFSGSAVITGSLLVSGSNVDFSNTTALTASIITSVTVSASGKFIGDLTGAVTGTATTASYVETAQTASFVATAQTASYILASKIDQPFTNITASGTISSSGLMTAGGITASSATITSASIGHLVVQNIISASTIFTSGSNTFGDAMDDVQTLIGTTKITGSAQITGSTGITGSLDVTGIFSLPSISNVSASIAAASAGGGIFKATGSFQATSNTLQVTGSTLESTPIPTGNPISTEAGARYSLLTSQSAWHFNHNVGVPSSNAWGTSGLGGSYFENFNHNTDVSEILRFVAGLLSSSAPNALPNTNIYTAIIETISNTTAAPTLNGIVPLLPADSTIRYLTSSGFASPGATLFNGVELASSIKGNSAYSIKYSNQSSGGTAISSSTSFPNGSGNTFLVGAGDKGTTVAVSGSQNFRFAPNADNSTGAQISQSSFNVSQAGAGVSNNVTVGTIQTANPAVIPNAFQDFTFNNFRPVVLYNNGVNLSTKESIGYYEISASIAVKTGSAGFTGLSDAKERILYSPLVDTDFSNNSLAQSGNNHDSLTAVSRSLSGAPYLTNSTFRISGSVTGTFAPMFQSSPTIARFIKTNSSVTMAAAPSHAITVSTNGGTIKTSNAIFPVGGGTARGIDVVPTETDFIRLSGSLSFTPVNITNIQQGTGFSTTNFTVTTNARTRKPADGETLLNTEAILYHSASEFNQPVSSGSLAYYGRAQNYDGGTLQGTSETFTGEQFRIGIDVGVLSGSYATGTHFITSSYNVYNLGKYDLQVKPGFLFPAGNASYKYWLNPNPVTTGGYKYYARAFQTDGGTKTSIKLNVGQTLQGWGSSTAGVAVAIMFESAQAGTDIPSGGGSQLPRAKLYDFATTTGADPASNQANNNQLNPFAVNIDVGINFGGSISGNQYTMPLTDTLNMLLNSTFRNYIILVRYKDAPTPLTNISVSY